MTELTLPPVQYDPDIDACLHTIDLSMTPTEDLSWLQRLGYTRWVFFAILSSYLAGVLVGAYLI